jgi:hypothetical protein
MTTFINQHSFTLGAILVIGILLAISLSKGLRLKPLIAIGGLTIGLGLIYLLLRPGPSSLVQIEQIEAEINAGTPVLIEFQSPY